MARLFPARGLTSRGAAGAPVSAVQKAAQLPPSMFWLPANPYRSDLAVGADLVTSARAFGVSALVYACMTLLAAKTIEAPLWIAEEDADGNVTWLPGTAQHPLADLLERPNADQEMADLLETTVLFYLMGPTLLVGDRDRAGRIGSVYAYDSDSFSVERARVGGTMRMYGRFVVTDGDGRQRAYGPDDVVYLRPPLGVSAVDAALDSIRLGAELRAAVKTSLRKAMRPGSVTTVGASLQDDQFQRLKDSLTGFYGGGANVGNNMVLDGPDIEWKPIPVNLRDLDLGPLDDATETAICQAFHVPPEMVRAHVALKHNGGLADAIKPAQALFYDQAQFPLWNRIERALTRTWLRPVDPDPLHTIRFVTDAIRALQPDQTADANVAKALTGIARLDEQRAMVRLPALGPDAGGDAIAAPAGSGQTAADPTSGDQTKAARGVAETKGVRLGTDDDRAAFWQRFEAKAARGRPAYEAAARRLFREERAGVLATLRAAVPKALPPHVETKDDGGLTSEEQREQQRREILAALHGPYVEAAALQIAADYALDGPYAQAWAEEFRVLLTATIQTAAGEFAESAGFRVAFSMENPGVIRAIEQRAAALVAHVTETTRQAIVDAIAAGRAEGLTVEQIAARVDERAFGAMARARARMIAETEVVGAINEAEWVAANESGAFRSKRWIHSRGAEGRRHHIAHESDGPNGGWVPMEHVYSGTKGARYGRPHEPGMPAHEAVRCDCVMAFSDADPAQAQEENA